MIRLVCFLVSSCLAASSAAICFRVTVGAVTVVLVAAVATAAAFGAATLVAFGVAVLLLLFS
jgi:hypothetical protein